MWMQNANFFLHVLGEALKMKSFKTVGVYLDYNWPTEE